MKLAFILSMPGVASWDGKWSGEGNLYAKIETINGKEKIDSIISKSPYYYDWGDGWCARIDVKGVDRNEAARIRRKQKGFCGYEWMINSIIENRTIRLPERNK